MDIKKLTRCALFSAVALCISAVEMLLPSFSFMPPGSKLGLSNVVTMFASYALGLYSALAVALLKSLFVLVTRGFTAFLMSMAGGVCSTLVCYLLLKRSKNGYIGIGIIGAAVHNCAQTAVCAVYAGNAVLWYLPFLAAASVFTGSVSGFLLGLLIKYFPLKYFRKD